METNNIVKLFFKTGDADGLRAYADIDAMLASETAPSAVWMDTSEGGPGAYCDAMRRLRASAVFCCVPIYVTADRFSLAELTDGAAADLSQIKETAARCLARGQKISREQLASGPTLRLLDYMYTRGEGYEMAPLCRAGSPWGYGYPQAAVFFLPEETPECDAYAEVFSAESMRRAQDRLKAAEDRGLVEKTTLVSRMRFCPKCHSSLLNYVDICPQCSSIDIRREELIHCFTCGHVAPREEFQSGSTLQCVRCGSILRHIGSDYDHPLESYICADCAEAFVEPDIRVQCLSCGSTSTAAELSVGNFYAYKLTTAGAEAARSGRLIDDFMLFNGETKTTLLVFAGFIKWLFKLQKRYPDAEYSVLRVKLNGLSKARDVIGEDKLFAFIEELNSRLTGLIRDTDIAAEPERGTLWLILPRTARAGGEALAQRIRSILTQEFSGEIRGCLTLDAEFVDLSKEAETLSKSRLFELLRDRS